MFGLMNRIRTRSEALRFNGIQGTLSSSTSGATSKPVPTPGPVQTGSESAQRQCRNEVSAIQERVLQHHSPREHALLVIDWTRRNIDLSTGMIFYDQMIEFYTEAIIEAGWQERSWNPVARELDLICTGGRKPYEWVVTRTGHKRRRRVYPILGSRGESTWLDATTLAG